MPSTANSPGGPGLQVQGALARNAFLVLGPRLWHSGPDGQQEVAVESLLPYVPEDGGRGSPFLTWGYTGSRQPGLGAL